MFECQEPCIYCNDDDFVQWSGQFLYAQLNNSSAWQQTSSLFILLIFSRDHIYVFRENIIRARVCFCAHKVNDCRQTSGTRCWAISHIGHSDHEDKRRWRTTHNPHIYPVLYESDRIKRTYNITIKMKQTLSACHTESKNIFHINVIFIYMYGRGSLVNNNVVPHSYLRLFLWWRRTENKKSAPDDRYNDRKSDSDLIAPILLLWK